VWTWHGKSRSELPKAPLGADVICLAGTICPLPQLFRPSCSRRWHVSVMVDVPPAAWGDTPPTRSHAHMLQTHSGLQIRPGSLSAPITHQPAPLAHVPQTKSGLILYGHGQAPANRPVGHVHKEIRFGALWDMAWRFPWALPWHFQSTWLSSSLLLILLAHPMILWPTSNPCRHVSVCIHLSPQPSSNCVPLPCTVNAVIC